MTIRAAEEQAIFEKLLEKERSIEIEGRFRQEKIEKKLPSNEVRGRKSVVDAIRKRITIGCLMVLISSIAFARQPRPKKLTFNNETAITIDGQYNVEKGTYPTTTELTSPTLILFFWGVFDGASIDIEVSLNGTDWVVVTDCEQIQAPTHCSSLVGSVRVRAVVTSSGISTAINIAGFEVDSSIMKAASGGGASGFDTILTGTNITAAMLVGTGATLGISGTGNLNASAIDNDGDGTLEFDLVSTEVQFDPNDDGEVDFKLVEDTASSNSLRGTGNTLRLYAGGSLVASIQPAGAPTAGVFLENNGPAMVYGAATLTTPTLLPNKDKASSGMGLDFASSDPALIRNGALIARVTEEGFDITDGLRLQFPQATAAPTVTESASYWDTDDKHLCVYDSTRWQCLSQIHGSLSGTTGTIVWGAENTYVQWTDTTVGPENGVVGSAATDDLIVPYTGDYQVNLDTSFSGPSNDLIRCNVHQDGSPGTIFFDRSMNAGGDTGAASASGSLSLAASEVLEVFCKNDLGDGTGTITIVRFSLGVKRL